MTVNNEENRTFTKLSHSASITSVTDFNNDFQQNYKCKNVSPKGPFESSHFNVCSEKAGAKILFATDDWFAAAENLLKDTPPHFDESAYCFEVRRTDMRYNNFTPNLNFNLLIELCQGKVMDGWETRRRREEGHDWCLIKLSDSSSKISGIEIDTAHFTGNHVPKISIEIANVQTNEMTKMVNSLPKGVERVVYGGVQGTGHIPTEVSQALKTIESIEWSEMLPVTPLNPGYEPTRLHYFTLNEAIEGNVVKVNYFPDGGVARLKLWSKEPSARGKKRKLYMPIETGPTCTVVPHSQPEMLPSQLPYDFTEISGEDNGGVGISCSNKHFGEPWRLVQRCIGKGMWDGWETARHPHRLSKLIKDQKTNLIDSPLNDWCILKLGKVAENGVARVILDTRHFLGNYPESKFYSLTNIKKAVP